jgi:hypothetical protein
MDTGSSGSDEEPCKNIGERCVSFAYAGNFESFVETLQLNGVTRDRQTHAKGTDLRQPLETLLFQTSDADDARFMEYLVQHLDFDVNARDGDGQTPLHRNATWGNKRQVGVECPGCVLD